MCLDSDTLVDIDDATGVGAERDVVFVDPDKGKGATKSSALGMGSDMG